MHKLLGSFCGTLDGNPTEENNYETEKKPSIEQQSLQI